MKIVPSQDEFVELGKKFNLIPVYTELSVDLDTPVSIYSKITGNDLGFMLESADTSKAFGRHLLVQNPLLRL